MIPLRHGTRGFLQKDKLIKIMLTYYLLFNETIKSLQTNKVLNCICLSILLCYSEFVSKIKIVLRQMD